MVLATIVSSLAVYLGLAAATDEMLEVMGSGDAAENEEDEKDAADEEVASTTTTATTQSSGSSAPTFVKKKKKVVDDWDAGEDEMAAEEDYMKSEGLNDTGVNDDEEYEKLLTVYKAFRKLKTEFDEKFRAIWA